MYGDVFVCETKRGREFPENMLCLAVPSHLSQSENENVFLTRLCKKKKKKLVLKFAHECDRIYVSACVQMCNCI